MLVGKLQLFDPVTFLTHDITVRRYCQPVCVCVCVCVVFGGEHQFEGQQHSVKL